MGGWRKAPGGQGRAPRLRVSLTTAPAPPGLLSASPLFGSSFFFVQSCSNVAVPAPCILAVNQNGLSFLSTETHVSGLTWPCIPPPQETSLPPARLWARPLPRPHLPGGAGVRVKGGETLNSQGGPRWPWLRGGAGLQRQELFVPVLEAGRPGLGSWLRARRQPPCRPHRPRLHVHVPGVRAPAAPLGMSPGSNQAPRQRPALQSPSGSWVGPSTWGRGSPFSL